MLLCKLGTGTQLPSAGRVHSFCLQTGTDCSSFLNYSPEQTGRTTASLLAWGFPSPCSTAEAKPGHHPIDGLVMAGPTVLSGGTWISLQPKSCSFLLPVAELRILSSLEGRFLLHCPCLAHAPLPLAAMAQPFHAPSTGAGDVPLSDSMASY